MAWFDFEKILTNPGLELLAQQVLANLDPKSLIRCREVSKYFKTFIDKKFRRKLLGLQILTILKNQNNFSTEDEAFVKLTEKKLKDEQLMTLLVFIKEYLATDTKIYKKYFLLEKGLKTKISQIACCENRADILEMLLEMGIDIQFVDFCGKTPMHYVGLYGSIEIFKLLQNHQPRETVTSLHSAYSKWLHSFTLCTPKWTCKNCRRNVRLP